ncbi:MAG: hypothetical protein M1401_00385 [Chloroflexi bacterium]|nr:hypothetical protein [Chloroflexota bacterium]MCL5107338.1 hypothetical protein [Chloroflexota bacterium]
MMTLVSPHELADGRQRLLIHEAEEYHLAKQGRAHIPDDVRRLAAPVLALLTLVVAIFFNLP